MGDVALWKWKVGFRGRFVRRWPVKMILEQDAMKRELGMRGGGIYIDTVGYGRCSNVVQE